MCEVLGMISENVEAYAGGLIVNGRRVGKLRAINGTQDMIDELDELPELEWRNTHDNVWAFNDMRGIEFFEVI